MEELNTPRPCFMPVGFMPFCFSAPFQFTPVLNLWSLVFGVVPFGWLIYIYLSLFSLWEYLF